MKTNYVIVVLSPIPVAEGLDRKYNKFLDVHFFSSFVRRKSTFSFTSGGYIWLLCELRATDGRSSLGTIILTLYESWWVQLGENVWETL